MVDRLEIPRVVDSFLLAFSFFLHDEMSLAVSKDELCFVKQRENQIVLTVENVLLAFYSVSSVLFRDKRRSIKEQNAMKSHNKTQT